MGAFTGRDLVTTLDWTPEELRALVDRALAIKAGRDAPALAGKVGAFLFFNPSVRTRVSAESALARFGGQGITLSPGADTWAFEDRDGAVMDGATQEHVRELAPVLSRMAHLVGIRRSELITVGSARAAVTASWSELKEDRFLHAFRRFAEVPVVNLESNAFHPMQGLADMATLVERLGRPRGRRYVLSWAWHPKSLPAATPHSQLLAACDLGMEVVLARPEGWGLDPDVVAAARARAEALGGSLEETDDLRGACRGARIVCAKAWGGLSWYGRFEEEARAKAALRERWIVGADTMALTDDGLFLHCLPVRRNVVVRDEVLDSNRSAVIDEAENRLWTAAAAFAEPLRRVSGAAERPEAERVDVRPARADEAGLAPAAAALIAAAAVDHDLARRSPEWLAAKITAGRAVVALLGRELVGFGYWAPWEDGRWVSHSGLVVRADLRGRGLGRRLKEAMLLGSRAHHPAARILSLTTSPAVLALNRSLGFRPASFDELLCDAVFWAGCATCRNAEDARGRGLKCCCAAMVLEPGEPR